MTLRNGGSDTPLVLPDGLLSFAETEIIQAALRLYLFTIEQRDGELPDVHRMVGELEQKLYRHREKLWTLNEHQMLLLLAPSYLDANLEDMVTDMRLKMLQEIPGYAERMQQWPLLPMARQTLDEYMEERDGRSDDGQRKPGLNGR